MTYPGYPPRPGPPRRSAADLAISITALVLKVLLGAGAALMGLFSLAFLDHCPPQTCSVDGAVNAVFTSLAAAALIGTLGLIGTVIALARRASAWPLAVGTLLLCVVAVLLGGIGYVAAVS